MRISRNDILLEIKNVSQKTGTVNINKGVNVEAMPRHKKALKIVVLTSSF
tara:strand:+ start:499 stop:648 length:150 start_codon:yes stop_codon:yes gene_type:complete